MYIKDGNIVYRSMEKTNFIKDAIIIDCWFSMNDNLIFENGEVRIYEKSKQFEKDIHKYKLTEKIKSLEFQNGKLDKIAKDQVKKDLELQRETTKFDKEIYLLKQMKQCWKHS